MSGRGLPLSEGPPGVSTGVSARPVQQANPGCPRWTACPAWCRSRPPVRYGPSIPDGCACRLSAHGHATTERHGGRQRPTPGSCLVAASGGRRPPGVRSRCPADQARASTLDSRPRSVSQQASTRRALLMSDHARVVPGGRLRHGRVLAASDTRSGATETSRRAGGRWSDAASACTPYPANRPPGRAAPRGRRSSPDGQAPWRPRR